MFTVQFYIKHLVNLPPSILYADQSAIYYRGNKIALNLHQESLGEWLQDPLNFNEDFLSTLQPLYPLSFSYRAPWSKIVLEYIFLKECTIPTLFFKNKSLKKSILAKILRLTVFPREAKYPMAKYIISEIERKWSTLPPEQQQELFLLFYNGKFDPESEFYILNSEGRIQDKKGRSSQYRPVHPFILRLTERSSPLYIPKSSSTLIRITLPSELLRAEENNILDLSSEEYSYFTSLFEQCPSCGYWHPIENIVLRSCPSCNNFSSLELETYSARATSKFEEIIGKSHKYSPHLFGVELEYENKQNTKLKEVLILLNNTIGTHAIFKRDGSLSNGIEICTRPASMDIHLEELVKFYNEEQLWDRIEVKPSCGMHVHIDRRKMTALTLGKLINFIQKKDNQSFIELIAERESNRFSKLGTDLSVTSFHRQIATSERYLGVNTQNSNTAELRIFKTPSNFTSFQKNMEFVSALTSFVQPCNSGIKDSTSDSFLHFVNKNKSTYKTLHTFLKGTT